MELTLLAEHISDGLRHFANSLRTAAGKNTPEPPFAVDQKALWYAGKFADFQQLALKGGIAPHKRVV